MDIKISRQKARLLVKVFEFYDIGCDFSHKDKRNLSISYQEDEILSRLYNQLKQKRDGNRSNRNDSRGTRGI